MKSWKQKTTKNQYITSFPTTNSGRDYWAL